MRGFGWARVFLGAVTTLALAAIFYLLVSVAIDPLLHAVVMGGGKLFTSAIGDLLGLVDALSVLLHLAAMLLALDGRQPGIQWLGQAVSGLQECG